MTNEELEKLQAECKAIAERYDVRNPKELREKIEAGTIHEHPAWEDYIIWKNHLLVGHTIR